MKTIGLIGGMSPESTIEYYRLINKLINESLGGLHSARIVMESVDLDEIVALQRRGEWKKLGILMANSAQGLEGLGADCVLICTNTVHKTADFVQERIGIPLIHIADATAEKIRQRGLKKVGLLGTGITMKEDFYRKRIAEKYGIEVIIPSEAEMRLVDDIIFKELCLGKFDHSSRVIINNIIGRLADKGAEGIILGCTELPLLIDQKSLNEQLFDREHIPLFNTMENHIEAAVKFALSG